LSDMGPREHNNTNKPIPPDDPRNILQSEMNNPAIEPVAKKYSELRYQLMPYTYTLAREARDAGLPLMRAMWLHYPDDVRARGIGNQFMWGRDLLVAPVFTKGAASREVYLPKGEWYDWWNGKKVQGGQSIAREVDLATMPIYVRAGAIVPIDPVRQYTAEQVSGSTTVKVFAGADGEFTLYDDDGISLDYLKGQGHWTRFTWNDRAKRLTIEPGAPTGAANAGGARTFTVQLMPEGTTREVSYAGKRVQISF
jgi:alpha-glucosidase (family GH31 glycosyl hydrolase)